MKTANNNQGVIPALTGVRAVAAYMVFFHHFNPFSSKAHPILFKVFNELYVGVLIFFVLSGFLITYRYFKGFSENKINIKKYLVNRVARIYPIYFLLTVICWAINYKNLLFSFESFKVLLLNITFTRGFIDNYKFSLVSQGWSLTVEECFYLTAPLIFFWFKLLKRNFLKLLFLSTLISVGIYILFNKVFNCYEILRGEHFFYFYTFFGRFFEFFVGIYLAIYLLTNNKMPISRFLFNQYSFLLGTIITLIGYISLVYLSRFCQFGISLVEGLLIHNFIMPIGIIQLFYGLIKKQALIIDKILSSRIFEILGKSSYVFYLIHVGFISDLIYRYCSYNLLLTFLIIIILSFFIWFFIEEKLNSYIKVKFAKIFNYD